MDHGSAAHRHSASKTRVNALVALRSIRGTGRRGYSPLPIVTFSVPTPSTPHSILSPGRQRRARLRSRHDDIAGVERDLLGQFGDYVRTLQINSVRPPSAARQLPNYRRVLVAGGCQFFTVNLSASEHDHVTACTQRWIKPSASLRTG